jgi:hypothetical protein
MVGRVLRFGKQRRECQQIAIFPNLYAKPAVSVIITIKWNSMPRHLLTAESSDAVRAMAANTSSLSGQTL